MARPLVFLLGLFLAGLFCARGLANRNGAPAGYTGAPAVNGRDCTACHAGTTNSGPGRLVITPPGSTYAPGSLLPLTVSLQGPLQNAAVNGYQMAAYAPGAALPLPGWVSPNLSVSRIVSDHIGHGPAGNGQTSWRMYFRTPAQNPTTITFYAAGNDADGNFLNTGDRIYTTNATVVPAAVPLSLNGQAVPRPGVVAVLDLHSPGDAGKAYVLGASLTGGTISVGRRRIPLGFDSLLLVTVFNLAPTVFRGYQGFLDPSGRAQARLALPANPALKGLTLYHAFVVLDPTQPFSIGTISNGLPVMVF